MKFYLASGLPNIEAAKKLAGFLKDHGHQQTYDWTVHGPVFKADQPPLTNCAVMQKTAESEVEGVLAADVVIVLLPCGRGTHIEMGVALAAKKPVIIVTPSALYDEKPWPCAFYFHGLVVDHVLDSVDAPFQLLDLMAALSMGYRSEPLP